MHCPTDSVKPTEIPSVFSSSRSVPPQRESPMHRTLSRANSARVSISSNSGPGIANYSKLSISMSYKNRQSTVYMDDSMSNNRGSYIRESHLDDKCRMTTVSTASVASTYCSSRDSSASVQAAPPPKQLERQISLTSSPINTISEDSDVSEVEIAAMQAKRALRRMCLSLVTLDQKNDENVLMDDDEEDENDSHTSSLKFPLRYSDEDEDENDENINQPVRKTKPRVDSDHISISRSDLWQLQTRLKQLEDKLATQADKQSELEAHIEREVRVRTKKIEESYQERIEELTIARDFEVDQELQRRLSEFSLASSADGKSRKSSKNRKGLFRASNPVTDLFRGSNSASSELEQFKDFLAHNSKQLSDRLSRSTLFRDTFRDTTYGIRETMDDPAETSVPCEVLEKIRLVIHDQDEQLEQAKYLISVAVAKMCATEEVVQDAFDEMGKMDARLEKQAAELSELRRCSSGSTSSFHTSNSSFHSSTARASGRLRS